MTCNDALRAMLDTDLEAVTASDTSPLGMHLASCARCRTILAELRADTARLAVIVARHPVPVIAPRVSRRATWLLPIPVAAVAVLTYVASTYNASPRPTVAASSIGFARVDSSSGTPVSGLAMERPRATTQLAPRPVASAVVQTVPRIEATRLPMPARLGTGGPIVAQASLPVQVQVSAGTVAAEPATVEVATTSGRAVVLRPSNANITVVWFY